MYTREWLIAVEHADLGYGTRRVLHDVHLTVRPARIVWIRGPNGAGKTTLLRALVGLKSPLRGTVRRMRPDLPIGWLGHDLPMYLDWTAAEFARWLHHTLFPDRAPPTPPDLPLMRMFWHEPLRRFSRGMQQRMVLHLLDQWRPPVICLDEPWTGLDVHAQQWVWSRMRAWRTDGIAVVFAAHQTELPGPVDAVWQVEHGSVREVT